MWLGLMIFTVSLRCFATASMVQTGEKHLQFTTVKLEALELYYQQDSHKQVVN